MAGAALAQTAGPSAAALTACSGHAEGSECTVTLEDGAHVGVCLTAAKDATSSCMPRPVPPLPKSVPSS
ncbi:MAG: hypothetical protein IPJ65_33695 [Archangiaceae bacterium]|nr:hypothetical protein [Archangiaceae bacterium]